ncbi:DUF389 domain-containing protein [Trichothermofontia sichuanensis B231]|uniref:DUF389 domain-containing protein n=1 Tax=Trichothermofontia sichuanensis TaxID=3045816 RepID=UPI002248514F|nr:DUF389 domain-containing protein [Trichothermofontia sichuanensis]UZQ54448.1 DUF389 domain-containing protein [Trichothermofontia sichuanensis B231]
MWIPPLSDEALERLNQDLYSESQANLDYLVLVVSSCLIASFGLLSNSAAVIIGAMIIAPLMLPIRAIAFAGLTSNRALLLQSLQAIVIGLLLAIGLSWLVGKIFNVSEFGSEVLARTQPNLLDLGIALAAGAISGFAKVRPHVSDALAGTAIAVALMPPLCVVGLTLSQGLLDYSFGAFLLYMTNLFGITLACQIIFATAGCAQRPYLGRDLTSWMTILFTLALALPLGLRTLALLQQSRIQASIRSVLLNRTITVGQKTHLNRTRVEWDRKIPTVYLYVVADQPPTPRQVGLVEQFLSREMGRAYEVVFVVSEVKEVRSGVYTPLPKWLQTSPSDSQPLAPTTPASPTAPRYDPAAATPSPPTQKPLSPLETLSTPTPSPETLTPQEDAPPLNSPTPALPNNTPPPSSPNPAGQP